MEHYDHEQHKASIDEEINPMTDIAHQKPISQFARNEQTD